MTRWSSRPNTFTEGKNLDDIRKELAQATIHFQEAIAATGLAMVMLAVPWKARDDTAKAETALNENRYDFDRPRSPAIALYPGASTS